MYTENELKQIETALLKLTLGEKIVSFTRSTSVGTQTVTFNSTQISDLERLRTQIKRHLDNGKSDYLRANTSKGL